MIHELQTILVAGFRGVSIPNYSLIIGCIRYNLQVEQITNSQQFSTYKNIQNKQKTRSIDHVIYNNNNFGLI